MGCKFTPESRDSSSFSVSCVGCHGTNWVGALQRIETAEHDRRGKGVTRRDVHSSFLIIDAQKQSGSGPSGRRAIDGVRTVRRGAAGKIRRRNWLQPLYCPIQGRSAYYRRRTLRRGSFPAYRVALILPRKC
jgi:hypothetical protein